jgi:hypothetical protein
MGISCRMLCPSKFFFLPNIDFSIKLIIQSSACHLNS